MLLARFAVAAAIIDSSTSAENGSLSGALGSRSLALDENNGGGGGIIAEVVAVVEVEDDNAEEEEEEEEEEEGAVVLFVLVSLSL